MAESLVHRADSGGRLVTLRKTRSSRWAPALAVLSLSCAGYPARMEPALRDFERGHWDQAIAAYADEDEVDSAFLSGAEAATVALAAGRWEEALTYFQRAVAASYDIESRALVGPERLAEGLSSWVLNDTAKAYQGEGFERVYVHCGLAMAYLALGKVDDVYVETRLANQLLETEEELYETEYDAGGLGHFISALTYELIGQPDQAYIDYRRMEEKGVGTALAGRALVRLATDLGRSEDLPVWEERFGADLERPSGAANVVVLAGVGLGPFKVEGGLTLPLPDGFFQMAVPRYQLRPQPVSALRLVECGTGDTVRTELVEDVSKVATENLEDRVGWMAAKSVARGVLKRELTKTLEDEYDEIGRIAGELFLIFSERADVRSWLTLPDSWQACRLFVPPGVHRFALEALGGETRELGTFELEPGETMIVLARSIGPNLYAHVIGGLQVETRPDQLPSPVMQEP